MFQPSMLQPGAQGAAAPQHNLPADTSASTQSAPVPGGSYMPVAGMAYLSSGYFAVAPQMAAFGGANAGGMPVSAGLPTAQQVANADPAATSGTESGHVTANATNALATPSMSGGYGAPGAAAMGMAGMMAMPVGFVFAAPMMMMPVFFRFMSSAAPMQPPAALPPAADAPDAAAPVATPEAVEVPARVEEDSPPAAEESTRRTIMEMNTADFKRFRSSQLNAELSTSLSLQLKTKDGDSVTLDFSQLDLLERSHFKGRTLDGEHKHKHSREISSDRVVNMSVDGELDEAERAAIDAVLGDVIEVANQFFSNQLDSAMNKLQSMELDTATLAELSLKAPMARSRCSVWRSGTVKSPGCWTSSLISSAR
jgi:hypothetical protein